MTSLMTDDVITHLKGFDVVVSQAHCYNHMLPQCPETNTPASVVDQGVGRQFFQGRAHHYILLVLLVRCYTFLHK